MTIVAGAFGVLGNDDGVGTQAQFWGPADLTFGPTGSLFVGDMGNRTIRQITSEGMVSTIAGASRALVALDGVGTDALFSSVYHITADKSGNVFVADTQSDVIRKIVVSTRQVTTIAGESGVSGMADGIGRAARFGRPQGVTVDGAGNLFIVDHDGQSLRKMILVTGVVSTVAGSPGLIGSSDGIGSSARFCYPIGVGLDLAGNAYVADSGNNTIRKITPAGVVTTVAGRAGYSGSEDGPLGVSRLHHPEALVADPQGNLFVADTRNHTIRQVSASGVVSTIAGTVSAGLANGSRMTTRFNSPVGVTVDPQGNVYVSDRGNSVIRKISANGLVSTFAGSWGSYGLATDATGNIYAASMDRHIVLKVTPSGSVSTLAGSSGLRGSSDGVGAAARFNQPSAVTVDGQGNVYVADSVNSTVRKITPTGTVSTLAGVAGQRSFVDGIGASARFDWPSGVAVDAAGTVFVSDSGNDTIRRIMPNGTVTTIAGSPGDSRIADGIGTSAAFHVPNSLALDPNGNLLVTESSGAIRKITPAGVVTTIGGVPYVPGGADGVGTNAQFWEPVGIAVDATGTVYISDTRNNTIRIAQNTPPRVTVQPSSRMVSSGASVTFTASGVGNGPLSYQWYKNGIAVAGATAATLTLESVTAASSGAYVAAVTNLVGFDSALGVLAVSAPPTILQPLQATSPELGANVTLRVVGEGSPAPTYQWKKDGVDIVGAHSPDLVLSNFQVADAGAYSVVLSNAAGTIVSAPAILGVSMTAKTAGGVYELRSDVVHPTGRVFDQMLLTGANATIRADPDQVARISFVDLSDDIVQVEFCGRGTLTLLLAGASGPSLPAKYNQSVSYMKGHASIVICGADETTNVSVFSVGRITAFDQTLFREIPYDGYADIGSISIGSVNGKFGGVRVANGSLFARTGITGIQAPGVKFTGPVFLGSVSAFDEATPTIILGACSDVGIAGGDLMQANGRPIQVRGEFQLHFMAGTDSHGNGRPKRTNRGRLEEDGVDVTDVRIVPSIP